MADLSTQGVRAPISERGNDLYETPPEAVHALLRAEKLPKRIWEPCCGPGSIARVLRSKGHEVLASDLVDYESPDQDHARRDFLMELTAPEGFECIVTNPPYKLAGGIIEHALELVPRVYMLLRLAFLESDRRSSILDCGRLRRVYVFANRLPMMHRDGWDGPRATSAMTFAWYVWNRDHSGPTTTKRIYWRPIEERLCAGCQQPFHARVGALTCSDRCRKRVSRLAKAN